MYSRLKSFFFTEQRDHPFWGGAILLLIVTATSWGLWFDLEIMLSLFGYAALAAEFVFCDLYTTEFILSDDVIAAFKDLPWTKKLAIACAIFWLSVIIAGFILILVWAPTLVLMISGSIIGLCTFILGMRALAEFLIELDKQ